MKNDSDFEDDEYNPYDDPYERMAIQKKLDCPSYIAEECDGFNCNKCTAYLNY